MDEGGHHPCTSLVVVSRTTGYDTYLFSMAWHAVRACHSQLCRVRSARNPPPTAPILRGALAGGPAAVAPSPSSPPAFCLRIGAGGGGGRAGSGRVLAMLWQRVEGRRWKGMSGCLCWGEANRSRTRPVWSGYGGGNTWGREVAGKRTGARTKDRAAGGHRFSFPSPPPTGAFVAASLRRGTKSGIQGKPVFSCYGSLRLVE